MGGQVCAEHHTSDDKISRLLGASCAASSYASFKLSSFTNFKAFLKAVSMGVS